MLVPQARGIEHSVSPRAPHRRLPSGARHAGADAVKVPYFVWFLVRQELTSGSGVHGDVEAAAPGGEPGSVKFVRKLSSPKASPATPAGLPSPLFFLPELSQDVREAKHHEQHGGERCRPLRRGRGESSRPPLLSSTVVVAFGPASR